MLFFIFFLPRLYLLLLLLSLHTPKAQDACAAQGGLELVLATIRDSGPNQPSGNSGSGGGGGGGKGGSATNEALAAAAKLLVGANPGSASKQSQSFGSPVATALQVHLFCGRVR
jgi:hypothetical protein